MRKIFENRLENIGSVEGWAGQEAYDLRMGELLCSILVAWLESWYSRRHKVLLSTN